VIPSVSHFRSHFSESYQRTYQAVSGILFHLDGNQASRLSYQ
jgi:hypothetical protein